MSKNTKRLVDRRGGILDHIKLQRKFEEIGNDPWVKKSRENK